ncbi:hypothetical protein MKX03_004643, partial [Papaver bracteatum]
RDDEELIRTKINTNISRKLLRQRETPNGYRDNIPSPHGNQSRPYMPPGGSF